MIQKKWYQKLLQKKNFIEQMNKNKLSVEFVIEKMELNFWKKKFDLKLFQNKWYQKLLQKKNFIRQMNKNKFLVKMFIEKISCRPRCRFSTPTTKHQTPNTLCPGPTGHPFRRFLVGQRPYVIPHGV